MRKNRILYATSGTAPGCHREAMQADHVARALSPWYDLDILCPMIGRQGHVMEYHGARLLRVPLPDEGPAGADALYRAMLRQLSDGVYDAVHVRSPVEGAAAFEVRQEEEFILVYEPSPPSQLMVLMERQEGAACLEGYLDLQRRLVEAADVLVVHGRAALERVSAMRDPRRPTVIVRPGVDVDLFHPMALGRGGDPTILVLETPHSGLGDLHGLSARQVDQPWGPEYWKPESPAGLALSINASAACVAMPPPDWTSWLDGTPFGLLEAAACQRPLIAPRLPEVVDMLGEASEPLLYDPEVPAGMTRLARAALEKPGDLGPLVEVLAMRVRAVFPASAMRSALVRLYAGLVPPRGEPPVLPVSGRD